MSTSKANWKPSTMTVGEGQYSRTSHPRLYDAWFRMLERCYKIEFQEHGHNKSYKGCSVDLHWHNLQQFAKDVLEMSPRFEQQAWLEIDKDLKYPGNKIYSKDTCLVISYKVNSLFTDSAATRGHLPIGVIAHGVNQYRAGCCDGTGKQIQKCFYDLKEAVEFYWVEKYKVVQMYMKKYPELSDVLYNYFFWFQNKHTFGFDHHKQWEADEAMRLAS